MSKNTDKLNYPLLLALETSGRLGSVALAEGDRLLDESSFTTPLRHSAEVFPAIAALLEKFNRKPEQIRHIYISIGPGSFTGLRIAATIAKSMHLANNSIKIVAVDTLDVIAANIIDFVASHTSFRAQRSEAEESIKICHSERPVLRSFSEGGSEESPKKIAAILDAKRGQFFIAVYKHITQADSSQNPLSAISYPLMKISPDSLLTPQQFLDSFASSAEPLGLLGEGLVYYKDKFTADGIYFFDQKYWTPSARKVHLLGRHLARANHFADPLTLTPTYLRNPVVKPK